jgi:cell wall-associated NlpC family hydrolase
LGLDTLPPGTTYGQYLAKSVEKGVPLSLAVEKANTHWPITQRGMGQDLAFLFGSAAKATKQADLVTASDYNQTVGLGANAPIVKIASEFLNVPYKWGGTSVKTGLDCSAFLQAAMAKAGVKIPRTTYAQVKAGQPVGLNQLQAGDAVFTEPGKNGPNHVGLYIGNGLIQESPHTGDVNKIITLQDFLGGGFVAARRYLGNG